MFPFEFRRRHPFSLIEKRPPALNILFRFPRADCNEWNMRVTSQIPIPPKTTA